MKRLLLLFTAFPLLLTACFNHTASLAVGGEGLRALANNLQSSAAPMPQVQRVQTNALYEGPAVQQDPTNETSAGESTEDNKIILTVSLTGDVRGNYYVTVDERRLRTNGDSCEIDNLPVGARVTVGVSVHIGDTRYVQKEAKTITLAAGTNSVDIELVEAEEPGPQLDGTVTAGDERIITRTVGESVSFQYNNSDVSEAVIHINDLPTDGVTARSGQEELDISSGTVTGAPGGSVTLIFNKAGIYTVTAWAAKDGYDPTTPRTYTINVGPEDFDIATGSITAGDGSPLPQATYNGQPTFLVGTDVPELRFNLLSGNHIYTGEAEVWASIPGKSVSPIRRSGEYWVITLPDDADNTAINFEAEAYGVNARTGTIYILKFPNSGELALDDTVVITSGSLTVAPSSDVKITAPTSGAAFTIESGGTLTLGGSVTIDGQKVPRRDVLVNVNGGTLNLQNNAKIQNNRNTSREGGGVYVQRGGNVDMTGGMISGNTVSMNGGGVFVYGGTFTMSGGTITENKATGYNGGGVYVGDGTFTMSGTATISGNSALRDGGGVCVENGTFNDTYSSITGNRASKGNNRHISQRVTYNGRNLSQDINN